MSFKPRESPDRLAPLMSSAKGGKGNDFFQTPPHIFELVRTIAPIGLDPCGAPNNPAGARVVWYPPKADAFERDDWDRFLTKRELAYCNPPYSRMESYKSRPGFANLIAYQAQSVGVEIISLVAARTETNWFDSICWQSAQAVCFLKGRLHFYDPETEKPALCWSKTQERWISAQAPFPSAVVYHGTRVSVFHDAFRDAGKVVEL